MNQMGKSLMCLLWCGQCRSALRVTLSAAASCVKWLACTV